MRTAGLFLCITLTAFVYGCDRNKPQREDEVSTEVTTTEPISSSWERSAIKEDLVSGWSVRTIVENNDFELRCYEVNDFGIGRKKHPYDYFEWSPARGERLPNASSSETPVFSFDGLQWFDFSYDAAASKYTAMGVPGTIYSLFKSGEGVFVYGIKDEEGVVTPHKRINIKNGLKGVLPYMTSCLSDANEYQGEWRVASHKDSITDATNVSGRLYSQEEYFPPLADINLIVRCYEDKTQVIIDWDTYVGYESPIEVALRIDEEEPIIKNWPKSSNSRGTFYPGSPISFLKTLKNESILTARLHRKQDSNITVTFKLEGVENVVADVRKTCGW